MKEDFLHYLWKYKKFDVSNLETATGEEIRIIHSGQYLQLAGPDFFNAQISIGDQKWAGNVEIHCKSSDWYVHHHEKDQAYENVILHVVWEHDTAIFRNNNTEIPVLELKKHVAKETLENYQSLSLSKSWIFCEKQLNQVADFVLNNWQERLFFERLERKSKPIQDLLERTNHDWEAVLFGLLAKNFGLNTNGDAFLEMARAIPFGVIRKECFEAVHLESLFLGMTGLLDTEKEDVYFKDLCFKFYHLQVKHQLENKHTIPVQFFKHRPDNFPTIRLSQLANLYHAQQQLFSELIAATSVKQIYAVFGISVSKYWETHYQFDKESPKKKKLLSKAFIDLLIINTVVPLQFAYAKSQGKDIAEHLVALLYEVLPEKNAVVDKFSSFGVISKNAFDTQSLLQLKNEYCNKSRCLECAIGMELLKSS